MRGRKIWQRVAIRTLEHPLLQFLETPLALLSVIILIIALENEHVQTFTIAVLGFVSFATNQ